MNTLKDRYSAFLDLRDRLEANTIWAEQIKAIVSTLVLSISYKLGLLLAATSYSTQQNAHTRKRACGFLHMNVNISPKRLGVFVPRVMTCTLLLQEFPPKSMFGSFESTIIKTRIEGITKWFAEVLSIPGTNYLQSYITMPTCRPAPYFIP
eukprot:COSAG06_NODE_1514_length_9226_cov_155.558782_10_plen_151_part_00